MDSEGPFGRGLFGRGLGAFADPLPPGKMVAGELRWSTPKTNFLEVLVEGGVATAALLAAGLVLIFRWSFAARLDPKRKSLQAYFQALKGAVDPGRARGALDPF